MMNNKLILLVFALFFGCQTKPFQYPIMSYKNTSNYDQFVIRMTEVGNWTADSFVQHVLHQPFNKNDSLNYLVKSGGIYKFSETFSFSGPCWMRRAYRPLNRRLSRLKPDLRIVAFTIDSTLQHYTICFDTTVANSKDSVYYFHSR